MERTRGTPGGSRAKSSGSFRVCGGAAVSAETPRTRKNRPAEEHIAAGPGLVRYRVSPSAHRPGRSRAGLLRLFIPEAHALVARLGGHRSLCCRAAHVCAEVLNISVPAPPRAGKGWRGWGVSVLSPRLSAPAAAGGASQAKPRLFLPLLPSILTLCLFWMVLLVSMFAGKVRTGLAWNPHVATSSS